MDTLQSSPVNASQIETWTSNDPVLARVQNMIQKGWRHTDDEDLKPYQRSQDELSVHSGCVLLGTRVVVPKAGHAKVLKQLHKVTQESMTCMVARNGLKE